MRHRYVGLAAVAALGTLLGVLVPGCGGLPRAPAVPGDDDGFVMVQDTAEGVAQDPPRPLALYPGDRVTLRLQSSEVDAIEGLTVDERGVLHVPLAGDVDVGGVPVSEAESRLETALQRFDRTVRVTVLITDPAGHQATILGAVHEPGRITIVPGMRVADLIAAAGGVAVAEGTAESQADLINGRLIRNGQALPISLSRALAGEPQHNVRVQPGDHLYIPAALRDFISVLGEVGNARVIAPRAGLRLSQALGLAGGYTRDANGGDIRIVRRSGDGVLVYRAAIDHIAAGEHADPELAPGDIVLVGSSAQADFRDAMTAFSPVLSLMSTTAIGLAIPLSSRTP